ncbi:hypothetical protein [Spirosoma panaciterrae]|uniref:hypothetical protein n=1 Tax=Spirosoma panaciterrae TaxID=496058 RepID=UPI00036A4B68|nr:hypothetical protein [Spirosoma panaciterrae]
MSNNLDMYDDESDELEFINDPIILRYAERLYDLTQELIEETDGYTMNREQIEQVIDSLTTVRRTMALADELATLDAILRMTFSNQYYNPESDAKPALTAFPLSGEN